MYDIRSEIVQGPPEARIHDILFDVYVLYLVTAFEFANQPASNIFLGLVVVVIDVAKYENRKALCHNHLQN